MVHPSRRARALALARTADTAQRLARMSAVSLLAMTVVAALALALA